MKLFSSCKKEEKRIAFIRGRKSIPFVHIQFPGNNMVYSAMIDTGCEVSILDSSIMKDIKDIDTKSVENVAMNGFGGDIKYDNCIMFNTDVMVCDRKVKDAVLHVSGIVSSFKSQKLDKVFEKFDSEYPVAMIIGSNTLKSIGGSVDYKSKVLCIRNNETED